MGVRRGLLTKMVPIFTVLLLASSSLAAPQFQGDSSMAKILQEQRFYMGDGKFGSAYAQEDGLAFKEESSGNNERIGQYSYIDQDGNTITVKYTAGVDGFRIIEGDHIPSGGQTAARAITKDEDGKNVEYDYAYYDDTEPLSPFVNPFDPTHQIDSLIAGDLAGHLAKRVFTTTTPPPFVLGQITTPTPLRIFPPGQIKLDRSPQGFNFIFKSQ